MTAQSFYVYRPRWATVNGSAPLAAARFARVELGRGALLGRGRSRLLAARFGGEARFGFGARGHAVGLPDIAAAGHALALALGPAFDEDDLGPRQRQRARRHVAIDR